MHLRGIRRQNVVHSFTNPRKKYFLQYEHMPVHSVALRIHYLRFKAFLELKALAKARRALVKGLEACVHFGLGAEGRVHYLFAEGRVRHGALPLE